MLKIIFALLIFSLSPLLYAADAAKPDSTNKIKNTEMTNSKVNQAGHDVTNITNITNNTVVTPKPKPEKTKVKPKHEPKPAASSAPAPTPASAKPAAPVNVETHGDKSPAIKGDGATVNYN